MITLPKTIEHAGQRILTTAQLAEAYDTSKVIISNNFNRNRARYEENKHFFLIKGEELKQFLAVINLMNANKARQLYLWTEQGALLHAKSLNTDKAWEVYGFLVENYFRTKQQVQLPAMSMMEMIAHIANNAVETENRLKAIEQAQEAQQKRIETISTAFELNPRTWRIECKNMVNKIARVSGVHHARIWKESYETLEARGHCNLRDRLERKKARMYENGATQTQMNAVTTLDVIGDDPKLTEIYISILREMAFKVGA